VLWIGTSGWQYSHWRHRFYAGVPAKRWLEHYAARFATVEVNNTFYRLPPPETFKKWSERVPADFVIAVKASRYLTHYRRLVDPEEPVARLLEHAKPLGSHLGPVLLQLPPDLRAAPDRLVETLRAFRAHGNPRVAFEARHESWFTDETRSILDEYDVALCLADRHARPVTALWRTASWTYLRFHQGTASPHPCYGRRTLEHWVERLVALWGTDVEGYVYFNNDGEGCALRDAIVFAELAARAGVLVERVPACEEAPVG
jgi:uncharacterized protein YecE (DUF72 family)